MIRGIRLIEIFFTSNPVIFFLITGLLKLKIHSRKTTFPKKKRTSLQQNLTSNFFKQVFSKKIHHFSKILEKYSKLKFFLLFIGKLPNYYLAHLPIYQ